MAGRKLTIAATMATGLAAADLVATASGQDQPPFGTEEDIAYSEDLWNKLRPIWRATTPSTPCLTKDSKHRRRVSLDPGAPSDSKRAYSRSVRQGSFKLREKL